MPDICPKCYGSGIGEKIWETSTLCRGEGIVDDPDADEEMSEADIADSKAEYAMENRRRE